MSSTPESSGNPKAVSTLKNKKSATHWGTKIFDFFSSYGLAAVLFFFLTVLTFVGTLEQIDHGLYEAQRRYFDSWWCVYTPAFTMPYWVPYLPKVSKEWIFLIPLPGGFLLMLLLFINLVCGAIIRARKGWKKFGVLLSHASMIFLLVAGFVSFFFKTEGSLYLSEKEIGDEYESYHERVIEIERLDPPPADGTRRAWVIHWDKFRNADKGNEVTLYNTALPFELQVEKYYFNSIVREAKPTSDEEKAVAVDGLVLEEKVRETEQAERNLGGAYVKLNPKSGGEIQSGILWGGTTQPWLVTVNGEKYAIHLAKQRWKMPFAVRLEQAVRENHPGTNKPKAFKSEVTVLHDGKEDRRWIEMNHPLRLKGFAVFQSQMAIEGPQGASDRRFSGFAVVLNPSDQWPTWACILAMAGLLIHFLMHLVRFINRSTHASKSNPSSAEAQS